MIETEVERFQRRMLETQLHPITRRRPGESWRDRRARVKETVGQLGKVADKTGIPLRKLADKVAGSHTGSATGPRSMFDRRFVS